MARYTAAKRFMPNDSTSWKKGEIAGADTYILVDAAAQRDDSK